MIGALTLCTPALAQSCNFTMPNINFGTIDLTANINYSTSVNFTANCTGIGNRTVLVCPNFNAGSGGVNGTGSIRYLLRGAFQLNFNLFRNRFYTNVWGSHFWGLPPTPPAINVNLGGGGTGSRNQTVRARVFSGQTTAPVGTYTSSFAGFTRINYAYNTVGNCQAITAANLNPTTVSFTVTATAGGSCSVTATNLNFGNQTLLNANVDATNTVSVRCPLGTPYTVGLNGGLSGATDPTQRQLDNGTDQISYGLYRDAARSQPWGETTGSMGSATGSGAFQNFTVYGRVPPQATPPADTYDDTIVVTVTY